MKICFITTIHRTIDSFILPLIKYMHENTDWDISVICSDDDEFAKMLPDYVHYYPVHMERGISVAGIKAMLKMKKIFKREKFDLIQYSTPNASLYASLAGAFAKVPVRLYCQWGMAYVGFSGIKRKIFKFIEKRVCKLSTWVEPDSKSNLDFSHKENLYPESKGSVIWNGSACGVDFNKFNIDKKDEYRKIIREKYSIPENAFVYIFIGRVTRDKGINELLQAYKNIENDNTYLMFLGGNEIDQTVNMDLYNWSLNKKNIIYVGNTNIVEQYLSAADCYVLPSYREGFGLSVIEAEAMGVPVVVTDIPGPKDAMIDNETGIKVPKADANALEEAMVNIRSMNLQKMGNKAHEFVLNSFEQNILFEKIIEDRKRLMGTFDKNR